MKKGEKSVTVSGAGKEKAVVEEKGKRLPIAPGLEWTLIQKLSSSEIKRRWINTWPAIPFV